MIFQTCCQTQNNIYKQTKHSQAVWENTKEDRVKKILLKSRHLLPTISPICLWKRPATLWETWVVLKPHVFDESVYALFICCYLSSIYHKIFFNFPPFLSGFWSWNDGSVTLSLPFTLFWKTGTTFVFLQTSNLSVFKSS